MERPGNSIGLSYHPLAHRAREEPLRLIQSSRCGCLCEPAYVSLITIMEIGHGGYNAHPSIIQDRLTLPTLGRTGVMERNASRGQTWKL